MDCSCIYTDADSGDTDVLTNRIVKARKEHRCGECNCVINKGNNYEYFVGVFDGDISAQKTCLDCVSIRDKFFCDGWYYGEIFEYLNNHIIEMGGEISSDCIINLTKHAKDTVCDMIEEYWEENEEE